MEKEMYQKDYEEFIASYKMGQTSGEVVGELIARMALYYGEKNNLLNATSEALNKKASQIVQSSDGEGGKALSVAKAEILIKASAEQVGYDRAKTHLQNIDQYINALKYLQKGVLNEYSHVGAI